MAGSAPVKEFQIVLDKAGGKYVAGEVLTGHVNLVLNNQTTARGEF